MTRIADKCNIAAERPQTLSNSITNPEKGLLQTQARQILMSILDTKKIRPFVVKYRTYDVFLSFMIYFRFNLCKLNSILKSINF